MKIFVGYDDREPEAYHVLVNSIKRQTKERVDILPLKHRELRKKGYFTRPWRIDAYEGLYYDGIDDRPFSTQFSHTRFLVPKLCNYDGWALFLDCDMLFLSDIKELWEKRDSNFAVQVVKHTHKPKNERKMDDMPQSRYRRKNWSSFMLLNCSHARNRALTPEIVSTKPGEWLHNFGWLEEGDIGHLGYEYNWIEETSPAMKRPKVVHYTNGGPWFTDRPECQNVMFADLWNKEFQRWQRDTAYEIPTILPAERVI